MRASNPRLLRRASRAKPTRPWAWWLLPLCAFALMAGMVLWLQLDDREKEEETRRRMVADGLSLDSQLRDQIELSTNHLRSIAAELSNDRDATAALAKAFSVSDSPARSWIALYLIDANNQVIAEHPPSNGRSVGPPRAGLTAHIETPVPTGRGESGRRLVARYPLRPLLEQHVPWWVSSRYVVRFVDDYDQVLAATEHVPDTEGGVRHRISFDPPAAGVYIELIVREPFRNWWSRVPLPFLLILPASMVAATWLLARQTQSVREAERAWRTEAGWRRAMEDSLQVGMRVLSMEGTLIYVSPRFAEMTGFSEAELVGKTSPMPYWASDEIDETQARLDRVLVGGAPKSGYEARWRRKDGSNLFVMILEAPLIDANGVQLGWMASAVDVTERKKAEEEERLRAEQLVTHARLVTVGEIASSLAHELNQPLSAIVSYNAGLKNALQALSDVPPRVRDALERQGEQAERAGKIVGRIRQFLSKTTPHHEPCDLNEIAKTAADLLRRSFRDSKTSLELLLADAPVMVSADRVLIEQVLLNLLRNAAEATAPLEDGNAVARRIRVRVQRDHQYGSIIVCDNGNGFGTASFAQLAAPFYSTKPQGMGLGLAICRSIIEAHRGTLLGHSQVPIAEGGLGGARFAMALPV
jgi:two-component system, LuxR family, sensor histidine kinase DctS